jgi:hypothetical protein
VSPKKKGGRYTPPKDRAYRFSNEGNLEEFAVPRVDRMMTSGEAAAAVAQGAPMTTDGMVAVVNVRCAHCDWSRMVAPFAGRDIDDGEPEGLGEDAEAVGMLHVVACHPAEFAADIDNPEVFAVLAALADGLHDSTDETDQGHWYDLTHHEGECRHGPDRRCRA